MTSGREPKRRRRRTRVSTPNFFCYALEILFVVFGGFHFGLDFPSAVEVCEDIFLCKTNPPTPRLKD